MATDMTVEGQPVAKPKETGLNKRITRRAFLGGTLAAAGGIAAAAKSNINAAIARLNVTRCFASMNEWILAEYRKSWKLLDFANILDLEINTQKE